MSAVTIETCVTITLTLPFPRFNIHMNALRLPISNFMAKKLKHNIDFN